MHVKLDKYLCEKYPELFVERTLPARESSMHWGITCDDGWFFLINRLCGNIQHHIDYPPFIVRKTFSNFLRSVWNKGVVFFHLPYRWGVQWDLERKEIPQVIIQQVKEKFGGLRFYYKGGDDKIIGMVTFAESLSYTICESCGTMSEWVQITSGGGWVQTLCPTCASNRGKPHKIYKDQELINIWEEVRNEKINKVVSKV